MRVKTNELQGRALDYAVAYSHGGHIGNFGIDGYHPSTDWAQGGPIIEREMIELVPQSAALWDAMYREQHIPNDGPTPLIAAMRCYVACKWNHEIEIPEEFV
jgi:hypothetical protein